MKMTKKRKSLQDKLRRKFGWKTDNNLFSGWSTLSKEKATLYLSNQKKFSNDLNVELSCTQLWNEVMGKSYGKGVVITINQYDDSAKESKLLNDLSVSLTFEELEMIYNIAKEKRFETIAERSQIQEEKES